MAEKAAQLPGRIYSIQPSSDVATKDDPKGRTSWQVEPRATENHVLGAAPWERYWDQSRNAPVFMTYSNIFTGRFQNYSCLVTAMCLPFLICQMCLALNLFLLNKEREIKFWLPKSSKCFLKRKAMVIILR